MAKPYKSLTISEDDDFAEMCKTVLNFDRALATILDHGSDSEGVNDFLNERADKAAPITLGELREYLGY